MNTSSRLSWALDGHGLWETQVIERVKGLASKADLSRISETDRKFLLRWCIQDEKLNVFACVRNPGHAIQFREKLTNRD